MAKSGKKSKVIVIDKKEIEKAANEMKAKLKEMGEAGEDSASKIKKSFEKASSKMQMSIDEAFPSGGIKGLRDMEQSLGIQRKVVEELTDQYKKAKDEFSSLNVGTQDSALIAQREKASKLFKEVGAELQSETEMLNKQEEAYRLVSVEVGKLENKSVAFYTQMRQIQDQMRALALQGKDNTDEYKRLGKELEDISVAYRKVTQEQKMMNQYGNMFVPGLIQGLSGLSGAFASYQGIIGMFVKDNGRLAEIQTKLQAAMSLTIGLQQVQQTLHSTSAFRIGVVRKATQAWTTAQNALNTSLGISKGLAGAFMTGGIMALVAGVGYLVTKYRSWSKEQDRLIQIQREFNEVMLEGEQNAQAEITNLDFLYKASQDQNKTQNERLKAVKELQRLYPDYLGNLSQEEILAGNGADAYEKQANAIIKLAKAQAAKDKIIENEKKRIELADKLEEAQKKQAYSEKQLQEALDNTGGYGALHGEGAGILGFTKQAGNAKENVEQLEKELDNLDKQNDKLKGSINVDDWIGGGGGRGKTDNPLKDKMVSLLDEIEAEKFNIAKQGINDRIELLNLEEENELASLERKLQDVKYSEEEKQELILLIQESYKIKREQVYAEESQKEQGQIEKSLESFKNYQTRKKEIEDRYAELRANAKGKDGYDVSLINKSEKEEIDKLNSEFYPQAKETVIDLTRASIKQLVKELSNVREKLKEATNPKDVEALQNRIDSVLNKLQTKSPFVAFKENLKDAVKDGKVDFEKLGLAIKDVSPELQGIADDARSLFGDGVGDVLDDLNDAIGVAGDLANSFASFSSGDVMGGISGILSASTKLFGNSKQVNKEHREALRLLKLQRQQLEHQVRLTELRNKLAEGKSIFGADGWGKAKREAEAYSDALKFINKKIGRTDDDEAKMAELQAKRNNSKNTIERYSLSKQIKELREQQGSALDDIDIVTGSRKKRRKWSFRKKRVDVWTPVLEQYPKLIDANGKFDKSLAETIMNTHKMSDAGKQTMQELIDNAQVMEDALESITDNLRSIFGELGDVIMESFKEASESGVRDFSKMYDSASGMLENLVKEMIYSVTLGDLAEEYSKAMVDIKLSGDDDKTKIDKSMDVLTEFLNKAQQKENEFNELWEYSKKKAEEQGYDLTKNSTQQESSKGVSKTASQDSIDVMDGRLTHVQETNQGILNSSQEIAVSTKVGFSTLSEQINTANNISLANMYHLSDIVKNTKVLPDMAKDMAEVKRNTKGLVR